MNCEKTYEGMLEVRRNMSGLADEDIAISLKEYGWSDWMNEFTDAKDNEPITEKESKEIDEFIFDCYVNRVGEVYRVFSEDGNLVMWTYDLPEAIDKAHEILGSIINLNEESIEF